MDSIFFLFPAVGNLVVLVDDGGSTGTFWSKAAPCMNWFKAFWKALTTRMPREEAEVAEPINNFTPRAQQVLALARKEADRFHHNFVGTEHLLLGLIRLGQGTAVNVLQKMGLNLEQLRQKVEDY